MREGLADFIQNILDFSPVLNTSISASWLILVVLVLRLLMKRAPKWTHVALWGIVALRLVMPFSIESTLSLIPSAETISPEMMAYEPAMQSEQAWLNIVTNPAFSETVSVELGRNVGNFQWDMVFMNLIWWVGMGLMALYALGSYVLLHRRVQTAVRIRDNIFQSEHIDSPFVLGIFRPKIFLPFRLREQDISHVLSHEQAHIRRKDHWWKPLGFLLLTIYWFNPLMWLAYILLCRDIELACDESVVRELGQEQRADYSQALLNCSVNRKSIAVCPLAFGEAGVKERVKNVLRYEKPGFWIILIAVVICIAVAVCFLTDPIVYETAENPSSVKYYLTINAEGVMNIEVSTPESSGGCIHADGTAFEYGEMVYLELLDGYTDLRGITVTALDADGNTVCELSAPEGDETIKMISADGWLLAPENVQDVTNTEPTEHPIPEETGVVESTKTMPSVPGKPIWDLSAENLTVTSSDIGDYCLWTNSTKIAVSVEQDGQFSGKVMLWTTENLSNWILVGEIGSSGKTCVFSGLTSATYYMLSFEGLEDCSITVSDGDSGWLDWLPGN